MIGNQSKEDWLVGRIKAFVPRPPMTFGHDQFEPQVPIMNIAKLIAEIPARIIRSRLARRLFLLSTAVCLPFLVAQAADPMPSVTTDLEDYAPFSFVQITGTGFQPGEIVSHQVVQIEGPAPGSA